MKDRVMWDDEEDDIPTIMISDKPGVTSSALFWPRREPLDNRQYILDVRRRIRGPIIKAWVAVKPSGQGEMQPVELLVQNGRLFVRLVGGVAGRVYTTALTYDTPAGQETWLITVPVNDRLERSPPIYPPSPLFGNHVTWPTVIGWAGMMPVFGKLEPEVPLRYIVNPALLGGF